MKKVIELQNIKRDFQVGEETVHALRGVSFTINEGEFVTIMGTSGSGKSTLLNTLGCLDTPTSGEYLLDDISVRTMSKPQRAVLRNRKIGFVGKDDRRVVYQCTGDGYALHLSSGHLVGLMLQPVAQTYRLQRFDGTSATFGSAH